MVEAALTGGRESAMDVQSVTVSDLQRARERHRRTTDRVAASLLLRPTPLTRRAAAPSRAQCRRTHAAVTRQTLGS
jgi:hypothetical protein